MRPLRWIGLVVLLLAACHNTTEQSGPSVPEVLDVRLQPLAGASGIVSPMDLQAPPGDPRIFIAERGGKIRILSGGSLLSTSFLDLSGRIQPVTGEGGLLSFTFDPQYGTGAGKDFVYVHFTENNLDPNGDIVVERYTVSGTDANVLDSTTVTPIIRIPHHQANNHYGGRVMFGPDGMFYISTGDGGGANNQFGNAQDPSKLLGKLLRIDVSTLALSPPVYAIPPDNPVWDGVGRNEVWAIGLRNPFRPAFDFPTGFLYIADVGQDRREEVDVVDATLPQLNYGWSIVEGTLCLDGPCDPATLSGLTMPVYEYIHKNPQVDGCAIIGGYVYRGAAMASLQGIYFFSDNCAGWVRGMAFQPGTTPAIVQAPNTNAGFTQSIGRDGAGELYVLTGNGGVLQIVGPP